MPLAGSERVNLVGVCVGGTLTAIALAVLAAHGEAARVGWAALLNTLVDFGDPGEIGVFTDEAAIERIEQRIRSRGYISADELGGPFLLMKANDLVWRYVVSSWMMGKRPPPFDLLAWNADGTRIPAAMHSQYLRGCYLENGLTRPGALTIDGVPIDMSTVRTPLYVLGSELDHIVPWRSSYRTTGLVGGEVTYRLSSGGHIAGLVNPPGGKKATFWAGANDRAGPGRLACRSRGASRQLVGGLGRLGCGALRRAGRPTRAPRGRPSAGQVRPRVAVTLCHLAVNRALAPAFLRL